MRQDVGLESDEGLERLVVLVHGRSFARAGERQPHAVRPHSLVPALALLAPGRLVLGRHARHSSVSRVH